MTEDCDEGHGIFTLDLEKLCLRYNKEYTPAELFYHCTLLEDAGYLETHPRNKPILRSFSIRRITWDGHEFLDAIRDEGTWKKTKEFVSKKVGSAPLEMVFEVARRFLQEKLLPGSE